MPSKSGCVDILGDKEPLSGNTYDLILVLLFIRALCIFVSGYLSWPLEKWTYNGLKMIVSNCWIRIVLLNVYLLCLLQGYVVISGDYDGDIKVFIKEGKVNNNLVYLTKLFFDC